MGEAFKRLTFGGFVLSAIHHFAGSDMLVLVVYDVPDDKRRNRLATFLEGYGRRVQYSVFECFLNLVEMRKLHQLVAKRVNEDEDNVRFYWISEEALSQVLTIGSKPPKEPPATYIV